MPTFYDFVLLSDFSVKQGRLTDSPRQRFIPVGLYRFYDIPFIRENIVVRWIDIFNYKANIRYLDFLPIRRFFNRVPRLFSRFVVKDVPLGRRDAE